MKIELLRIAIDFGLMVLIWMVQLLIYPSFRHFASDGLGKWHKIYSGNMTVIVAPMMFTQVYLAYHYWINLQDMYVINITYTILVALTWVTTFLFFIPIHATIDKTPTNQVLIKKLINYNWMRVLLWSTIVAIDICLFY